MIKQNMSKSFYQKNNSIVSSNEIREMVCFGEFKRKSFTKQIQLCNFMNTYDLNSPKVNKLYM